MSIIRHDSAPEPVGHRGDDAVGEGDPAMGAPQGPRRDRRGGVHRADVEAAGQDALGPLLRLPPAREPTCLIDELCHDGEGYDSFPPSPEVPDPVPGLFVDRGVGGEEVLDEESRVQDVDQCSTSRERSRLAFTFFTEAYRERLPAMSSSIWTGR